MRLLIALSLSLAALPGLQATGLQRFEAVEPHMGTLVRIVVYTPGEREATEAFRAAFHRIRVLDEALSDYRRDSELNQITRGAVGKAIPVGADLFAVLRASQDLAEATGGAFDITQGPVVRLWREARNTGRAPDPDALQEAATRSGFRRVHLDADRQTVTFDTAGMALDAGAIGKGYAASEALAVLSRTGVSSALVAVSGDLAFSDAPPGRRGWRIAIHSGTSSDGSLPGVLELTHSAVSTSGSSEQHVEIDGQRYSHIVDPVSRAGLVEDLTVTVVAGHGIEADGLATAVSVLGVERGLALIDSRPGAAALIIRRTPGGAMLLPSSRFRELSRQHGISRAEHEQ